MRTFPSLTTTRLHLRCLTVEDAETLLELYSREEVTRYSEMPTLTTLGQARGVVQKLVADTEQNTGITWAITLSADQRMIGLAGAQWHQHNYSALLSYDLLPAYWRQGFGTEAVTAVCRHMFDHTTINRITATTTIDNAASRRLLLKLGFSEEGVLRDWALWKGNYMDLRCFSLLRRDRAATKPRSI